MSNILKWEDRTPNWSYEWKKCSDRMPEKDGRFLVYVKYNCRDWVGISSLRQGKFDDRLTTHWMELPEPPK